MMVRPSVALWKLALLIATCPALVAGLRSQDPFEGRNKGKFSILRDAELSLRLAETRAMLLAGKQRAAVENLLAVLRAGPAFVNEARPGRFVGLRERARMDLGKLDAKSRQIYQSLVQGELESPVRDALIRRDEAALSRLASRFPYTDSGEKARLACGDLALERGDYLSALQSYSLFDGPDPDNKVLFRKLLCRKLLDLPIDWNRHKGLQGPDGSTLETWLDQSFRGRLYGDSQSYWPAYGGGLEGSRLQGDASRPNTPGWSRQLIGLGNIQYNMHAVTDGRRVFVNSGTAVEGLDLWTGRGWQQLSPLIEARNRQEFAMSTSIRHVLSSAIGKGVLVAPLQVPVKTDEGSARISFRGIPIMAVLPVRRLFAFDSESGKLLWSHWDPENPDRALYDKAPLDTCGPPTIIGDRIYVPTHKLIGGISYYVSCFDLHTGKPIWKTLLLSSQIEVNMFGNAQWEFSASPLAFADGVIYGCTNLGAAFSLRCDDGSIRWLREYDVTSQGRTRMYVEEREVYWANNPPVVSNGVCVFTPLDSRYAIALDTETGNINWRAASYVQRLENLADRPEVFWMLGVSGGYVYFQGHALTRVPVDAIRRTTVLHEMVIPPALMGMQRQPDRKYIPRGVLSRDRVYLPYDRRTVAVFDHDGKRVGDLGTVDTSPDYRDVGNLLITKDILFSLICSGSNSLQLDAYFSRSDLLKRARQRTQVEPRSAEAWLDLSELLLSDPDSRDPGLAEAASGFRRAMGLLEKAGQRPRMGRRARHGLFNTELELATRSYPIDRKVAFEHFTTSLALAREMTRENDGETRLLKLMVELLDRYPEKRAFREKLLDELEQEHASRSMNFPLLGRVPIGLFVILDRLSNLPRTAATAPTRLTLLRRMLLDYGSVQVDGEPARIIALERSRGLLENYGRKIYAPIEKEARTLLEAASDDPAKLQKVLDFYPLSDTARFALIHLARSAAERGDLDTCLRTWDLARTRLEGIPKELPPSMAAAASKSGNLALSAAFEAMSKGERLPARPLAFTKLLASPKLVELPGSLSMTGREVGAGSASLFLPTRMRGFRGGEKPLPLLLHDQQNQLLGYEPGEKGRGFQFDRAFFRLRYEKDYLNSREPCIQGRVLILPEPDKIRAFDLDRGQLVWTWEVPTGSPTSDADADTIPDIVAAGPLRTGLYAWVTRSRTAEGSSLEYEAREPLTGKRVFKVLLEGPEDTDDFVFREGFFFVLSHMPDSSDRRLTLHDGLTGAVSKRFDFDGTHLPKTDPSPDGILFTEKELFYLASPDKSGRYALFAYDHEGKLLWSSQDRELRMRDNFFVLEDQVFLAARFGRNADEGRAWFLDRKTGLPQRKIDIGFSAQVLGLSFRPALHGAMPVLLKGQDQDGRMHLYALNPVAGNSSWVSPLRWGARSAMVSGSPIMGRTFLCLARSRRRGDGRLVDLHLFQRETGDPLPAPPEKGIPSNVEIAEWNGQLLVHGRLDHTWVYADRMGK